MGEARRITGITNTEKAITRKRPQKLLKAVTHAAENLIAIRALKSSDTVGPLTEIPVVTRNNPTVVPAHPYAVKADDSADDFSEIHASNDHDVAISRVAAATQFALRNKVAVGVLAAITIGAVIGGTQMSSMLHEPTAARSDSLLSPALDAKRSLPEAPLDTEKALPPNASSLAADKDPIAEGLNAISQQEKQYLDEIEQLRSLNVSLHEEIDQLGVETTDLNYELLQLELALSEKEAKAPVETLTVYNFINVSAGNHVQDSSYDGNSDYSYNNAEQSLNDDYYDDREEYYDESEQYYEEPIPVEWDSNGQPIAFADAYSSEEPIEWDSNGQPVEYIDVYSEDGVLEEDVYYDEVEQYDLNDNINYQGEQ